MAKEQKPCLCRVCGSPIKPFMTFGQMPLGNGFRDPNDQTDEYKFEMMTAVCPKCSTFQLIDQPKPEQMFHEKYAFFSGTSQRMKEHFKDFALSINDEIAQNTNNNFVVEIGSNDGILIGNLAKKGLNHLGIEPSANVAEVAKKKGISTQVSFFSKEIAEKIVTSKGRADAVFAANVICHIPTINDIALGIDVLLKDDGIFVFEEPYLGDVLEKTTYDQIYDEHVFLFSLTSVSEIFNRVGMEIFRAEKQWTHGGSMRYWITRKGVKNIEQSVHRYLEYESNLGIKDPNTYIKFKQSCEMQKRNLLKILSEIKNQGKRVIGYGATSKSTTILNYCGINSQHIEFISDTTPIKQGQLTPGSRIPVKAYSDFEKDYPEYALLFAYNHSKEIMDKEYEFKSKGGKWIVYVPEVKIV